jgi:hypothetical protein
MNNITADMNGAVHVLKGNCESEILFIGRYAITSRQGNSLPHSSRAVILLTSENLGTELRRHISYGLARAKFHCLIQEKLALRNQYI